MLQIVDLKGTVVMEEVLNRSLQQVNIVKLLKGVHMLKVNNGETTITSKFVKK